VFDADTGALRFFIASSFVPHAGQVMNQDQVRPNLNPPSGICSSCGM